MRRPAHIMALSLIAIVAMPTTVKGQYTPRTPRPNPKLEALTSSGKFRIIAASAPLIVGGLLAKKADSDFRGLRNEYWPAFENHADDYLQYAPLMLTVGLKGCGVESRSSWGRMAASVAISHALMTGAVSAFKYGTDVMRPDGTTRNSFPSGHTATAFMNATILTREYGHKTPLVGIGAYATAAGTGFMRMANNRHWLSDVLTGAGIGILTSELGYAIGDLIFEQRGLNVHPLDDYDYDPWSPPHFVGVFVGVNIPLCEVDVDNERELNSSLGAMIGVEGAYFFNTWVGIGGRLATTSLRLMSDGRPTADDKLNSTSASVGVYASAPLAPRLRLGAKALAGYARIPSVHLTEPKATIPRYGAAMMVCGLSGTLRVTRRYELRLFADYTLMPPYTPSISENIHSLTVGSAFCVSF